MKALHPTPSALALPPPLFLDTLRGTSPVVISHRSRALAVFPTSCLLPPDCTLTVLLFLGLLLAEADGRTH